MALARSKRLGIAAVFVMVHHYLLFQDQENIIPRG
jgi:hypothetical protein